MTRTVDVKAEERELHRRDELIKALEFGIVGALQSQGIDFLGFALRYEEFNCLLTVKADRNGERYVAFVGSDTIMNCFLKAQSAARHGSLRWRPDQYHQKDV